MQTYLLSILYLLLGSSYLLADSYGVRFPFLLSIRHAIRTKRSFALALVIAGAALTAALIFVPMDPGPWLLGDLLPLSNTASLTIYYLYHLIKGGGDETRETVVRATGQYVEQNKRHVGYLTLGVALLHFLLPHLVIL
jgi:hypothetical protein